ncbi:MAG TPA: fatty acid hydroxylase, partial [Pseudomonas sp.]|nr:fatty acid hydroxylase [Pseudomonas sp.]
IRQMHRLHALHHRRELMQGRNFNIVLPLMDYLFGTLYWEPNPNDNQESS